jgi:hypothetical protein
MGFFRSVRSRDEVKAEKARQKMLGVVQKTLDGISHSNARFGSF